MKKTITLAVAIALAMGAYAQQESAFIDVTALGIPEDYDVANPSKALSELCKSENVTMRLAEWDEPYKQADLVGDADAVNEITIDGTTYSNLAKGIQGKNNPKPSNLQNGGQQEGAVAKFDVNTDGYLYVIGKISNNKSYYVWEGNVPEKQGRPVAYTICGAVVGSGVGVRYTLPANNEGYYELGNDGYDTGTAYKEAQACVATYMSDSLMKGNILGVIAFPVYGDVQYYVNACGSKLTENGFVFIPGATTLAPISIGKDGEVVCSFEGGEAAIENVTADADDENAPVYNINGQQVGKDAKGLLIRKGKKFYNR